MLRTETPEPNVLAWAPSHESELEAIGDLAESLINTSELDVTLQEIVVSVAKVLSAGYCSLYLRGEDKGRMMLRAFDGAPDQTGEPAPGAAREYQLGEGLIGRVAKSGQSERTTSSKSMGGEISSHLAVPILFQTRVIGALSVSCSSSGAFAERHARILSRFADLCAPAIINAKLLQKERAHRAAHDSLTNLFNRQRFECEVALELAEESQSAVIWIDIDRLAEVNDAFGHAAGDQALIRVGQVLSSALRAEDLVARFGGDEFTVLLRNIDALGAEAAARRLVERVRKTEMDFGKGFHALTVSAGVALTDQQVSLTSEEFMRQANLALHEAKAEGGNGSKVYRPGNRLRREFEARRNWRNLIHNGGEAERFSLDAQPIVRLNTGNIERYELLLRYLDADGGVQLPGAFLGFAESCGMIREIDRWVADQAIEMIEQGKLGPEAAVEINLSSLAFDDDELLELLLDRLSRVTFDPSRLIFEITETAAVRDMERANAFIAALRRLGCRFTLDDFGVGHSSFYYLRNLRVDGLKIAGNFIQGIDRDPVNQQIVRSITEMARGLGKEVIAECVDSWEGLELLGQMGVDYAQGFMLGAPQPTAVIRERNAASSTG